GNPHVAVKMVVEPVTERHDDIRALGITPARDLSEAHGDPEVEAVILTTPNTLHEEHVTACARAGKHVFCEKPLGLTAASARRSVQACVDAVVQLGVGHERRVEPAMGALAGLSRGGALGTIMHAAAAFCHEQHITETPC